MRFIVTIRQRDAEGRWRVTARFDAPDLSSAVAEAFARLHDNPECGVSIMRRR